MMADKQLELHIVLVQPPAGVPYALQKGGGSSFTAEQQQISSCADLLFACTVRLKQGRSGQPDFGGPYVQGIAEQRFLYIGIGKFAGFRESPWERRLKIPLRGITSAMIAARPTAVIKTFIEATDALGGPACATPKPFAGWQ